MIFMVFNLNFMFRTLHNEKDVVCPNTFVRWNHTGHCPKHKKG